jgi:aryl-alcohol dehydrogenase-like predicted oxidoreductase
MDRQEHVSLGRTGLQVSRLGVASSYGVTAYAIEKAYHDYGVNCFYWGALRRSGMRNGLRRLARKERDRIIIALQSYDRIGWFIKGSIHRGLKALQVDYADILILGWHQRRPNDRLLDRALRLREQGLVKSLAVSGHHRPLFREFAGDESSPIDILMIRYNAAHRGAETDVFPYLPRDAPPGVMCFTATRWGQLLKQRRMPKGERALSAAECYRFVMSNPAVDVCFSAPANTRQMEEALEALEEGPLSDDEMARVRRIGDHVHG